VDNAGSEHTDSGPLEERTVTKQLSEKERERPNISFKNNSKQGPHPALLTLYTPS